jgi:hypothetical protein
MADQAHVPGCLDMGPLFGPPHQRSTMHEQRALYRIHGQVFVLLNTVGFRAHGGKRCRDEGCASVPPTSGVRPYASGVWGDT